VIVRQAQEACGPLEIDNALSTVRDLEKDIQEAKASAEEGKLKPLPGETVRSTHAMSEHRDNSVNNSVTDGSFLSSVSQLERCSQDLGTSTKAVSAAMAQLLSEATQGNENYTGGFSLHTLEKQGIQYII